MIQLGLKRIAQKRSATSVEEVVAVTTQERRDQRRPVAERQQPPQQRAAPARALRAAQPEPVGRPVGDRGRAPLRHLGGGAAVRRRSSRCPAFASSATFKPFGETSFERIEAFCFVQVGSGRLRSDLPGARPSPAGSNRSSSGPRGRSPGRSGGSLRRIRPAPGPPGRAAGTGMAAHGSIERAVLAWLTALSKSSSRAALVDELISWSTSSGPVSASMVNQATAKPATARPKRRPSAAASRRPPPRPAAARARQSWPQRAATRTPVAMKKTEADHRRSARTSRRRPRPRRPG